MKLFVHNIHESILHPESESFLLRAGYLISDTVVSVGSDYHDIFTTGVLKGFRFKDKLELLEIIYDKSGTEEELSKIKEYKELFKVCAKIKHPTKEVIASTKILEAAINDLYDKVTQTEIIARTNQGLMELSKLADHDGFSLCHMDMQNVEKETAYQDGFNFHAASSFLLRVLNGYEEDKGIFILPPEFISINYPESLKIFTSADDPGTAVQDAIYMEKCLELPYLGLRTAEELIAARGQMKESRDVFIKAVDEWQILFTKTSDSKLRTAFLKEKILPACSCLQKDIDTNEILHRTDSVANPTNMKLFIGEIAPDHLWEFYRRTKVIRDDTWEKIKKGAENNERYATRWPVLFSSPYDNFFPPAAVAEQDTEVRSVRKFIPLD